jgi:uncharacterized protein YhbP (UPF0306 family)
MDKEKTIELITQFLSTHSQMVIATYGDFPWISTVYFSLDEDLNCYFLSNPETLHCKQIAQNPQVAISIADSPQDSSQKKKGIQISGMAKLLTKQQEVTNALELWKKTLNVNNAKYSYEGMMSNQIKGRMYKVQPKKIKFFNQELWAEGEEPLIEL